MSTDHTTKRRIVKISTKLIKKSEKIPKNINNSIKSPASSSESRCHRNEAERYIFSGLGRFESVNRWSVSATHKMIHRAKRYSVSQRYSQLPDSVIFFFSQSRYSPHLLWMGQAPLSLHLGRIHDTKEY